VKAALKLLKKRVRTSQTLVRGRVLCTLFSAEALQAAVAANLKHEEDKPCCCGFWDCGRVSSTGRGSVGKKWLDRVRR
jgi:hypothetical protein